MAVERTAGADDPFPFSHRPAGRPAAPPPPARPPGRPPVPPPAHPGRPPSRRPPRKSRPAARPPGRRPASPGRPHARPRRPPHKSRPAARRPRGPHARPVARLALRTSGPPTFCGSEIRIWSPQSRSRDPEISMAAGAVGNVRHDTPLAVHHAAAHVVQVAVNEPRANTRGTRRRPAGSSQPRQARCRPPSSPPSGTTPHQRHQACAARARHHRASARGSS